jgi:ComF family protein
MCETCLNRLPVFVNQTCFQCHTPTRYGERCARCLGKSSSPLDALFVASCYQVPLIKKLLHAYKYSFVEELSTPLAKLLGKGAEHSALPLPDILVTVPLHQKRLRWRGFDQVKLLAEGVKEYTDSLEHIPLVSALRKTRHTKPQQKTKSKKERWQHIQKAFFVTHKELVKGKTLWLFDDVVTSKSTVLACAQALKEAGAKKVYAVVLAQD